MTLKKLAEVLQREFVDGPSGLPEGFMVVNYRPAKGKVRASLDITIGQRDLTIDDRGSVVGAGTALMPMFKITKAFKKRR